MMSKQLRLTRSACVLACVLLAASQLVVAGQKYGVTVLQSKSEQLAKAKTYVWITSQPSVYKEVDQQIKAAVDRELAARGLKKLDSGPSDVVVTYGSLNRSDVDLSSRPAADGARTEHAIGTLLVDVRDPASRDSLFRVRMDTPIDKDPVKLEAAINAAVTSMFAKYPPSKR